MILIFLLGLLITLMARAIVFVVIRSGTTLKSKYRNWERECVGSDHINAYMIARSIAEEMGIDIEN